MKIDCHLHLPILSERNIAQSKDLLLNHLEMTHIDYGILIPDHIDNSPIGTLPEVLEVIRDVSNLFLMGTLDIMKDDPVMIDRLSVLMSNQKIVAVKIFPGHDKHYPNDSRLFPILELLVQHDLPLVIHTGWNTQFMIGERFKYVPEAAKWNDPRYIVDLAKQFPDLKIVIAHLFWPEVDYCWEITRAWDRIYFDTSALADEEVIHATGSDKIANVLQKIIHDNPKRLMFGTDYDCCPISPHIDLINSMGLNENDQERVFCLNAIDVFRLKI